MSQPVTDSYTGASYTPIIGKSYEVTLLDEGIGQLPRLSQLYAKATNAAFRKRYGRNMDDDAIRVLAGQPLIAATPAEVDTVPYPKPTTLACPKCSERAIRGPDGCDAVIELGDHDMPPELGVSGTLNGCKARVRVCSECGHVWAGIVRIQES